MGRGGIKKDTDQDVYRDEQTFGAEKRLQKVHYSSHPLDGALAVFAGHVASGLARAVDLSPSRHPSMPT